MQEAEDRKEGYPSTHLQNSSNSSPLTIAGTLMYKKRCIDTPLHSLGWKALAISVTQRHLKQPRGSLVLAHVANEDY